MSHFWGRFRTTYWKKTIFQPHPRKKINRKMFLLIIAGRFVVEKSGVKERTGKSVLRLHCSVNAFWGVPDPTPKSQPPENVIMSVVFFPCSCRKLFYFLGLFQHVPEQKNRPNIDTLLSQNIARIANIDLLRSQ